MATVAYALMIGTQHRPWERTSYVLKALVHGIKWIVPNIELLAKDRDMERIPVALAVNGRTED